MSYWDSCDSLDAIASGHCIIIWTMYFYVDNVTCNYRNVNAASDKLLNIPYQKRICGLALVE